MGENTLRFTYKLKYTKVIKNHTKLTKHIFNKLYFKNQKLYWEFKK